MNAVLGPLAQQYLDRARDAAKVPPKPRPHADSRIADKFLVRGYAELFSELAAIGRHHGRSLNSEMVAAVMESLHGHERSMALLRILMMSVGNQVATQVLADLPCFEISACKEPAKFTVRFPPEIRDTIRLGVQTALSQNTPGHPRSMNSWFLEALVAWVKLQRQQYALLSAAISLEKDRLSHDERST